MKIREQAEVRRREPRGDGRSEGEPPEAVTLYEEATSPKLKSLITFLILKVFLPIQAKSAPPPVSPHWV